jgi:hypothetical protein
MSNHDLFGRDRCWLEVDRIEQVHDTISILVEAPPMQYKEDLEEIGCRDGRPAGLYPSPEQIIPPCFFKQDAEHGRRIDNQWGAPCSP